jgi:hypothetical protein
MIPGAPQTISTGVLYFRPVETWEMVDDAAAIDSQY